MTERFPFVWTVQADAYRITGRMGWADVARQLLTGETFAYVFFMRLCAATSGSRGPRRLALLPLRLVLRRLRYRMGINIPFATAIGPGLLVGHAGGIVVNAATVIGRNCNLSHNVTIGSTKGRRAGVPTIGDDVYIGPGAVLFGNIVVGDGAAVGANAVVVDDVPPGATVAGSPARVVSRSGSQGWVNRTDYPQTR